MRVDAAFAKPEIYEALEERGMDYAIRIPANKSLELEIEDILFRSPGRPSAVPLVRYKSFLYREGRGDSSETPAVAGRRRAASEKCGWQHACGVPTGRSKARRTPIGDPGRCRM